MPSAAPDHVEQRILETSVRLPPGAAVTGWAACRLHGGGFFDGLGRDGRTPLPVPVVVGTAGRLRPDPGVEVHHHRLDGEVVVRHGIPCARVERAVFDAARFAGDVREATVAVDMAAAAELTSVSRLAAYAGGRLRRRGVAQVRSALRLASERSRSPAETRARLVWVLDAGLPPPLANWPVLDSAGRLLGIADLLDVEAGLVGEYDGADHRGAARHASDIRREDGLRRAGLEYVTITGHDLGDRRALADRLLAARDRAARIPGAARRRRLGEASESLDSRLDRRDIRRDLADVDEVPPRHP